MAEGETPEPSRPTRRRAPATSATGRLRQPAAGATTRSRAAKTPAEPSPPAEQHVTSTPPPTVPTTSAQPPSEPPVPAAEAHPVRPESSMPTAQESASSWVRRGYRSPALILAIIALVVGILAGGFTAYYEYTRPATYRSSAVMLIDQPATLSASTDPGVVSKLSQLRIKYAGIIETAIFAKPVARQTGLPAGVILGSLRATVDPNTLLTVLTATTRDPAQSKTIAEAAATELTSYAKTEQDAASVPKKLQVTFTTATPAGAAVRVTPDRGRAKLVGLFVFIAITVVGLLGADLLRRRRRV